MSRVLKFLLSLFIFAVVCYVGLGAFVNNEVSKEMHQAVANTPGMSLSFSDLDVDIFEHTVRLDKVAMTLPGGQSFQADVLNIVRYDSLNPVPHYATVTGQGVTFGVNEANLGGWTGPFKAMGVNEVRGDVVVDFDYNPETMMLTLNEFDVTNSELGDLRVSGIIDRLDLSDLRVEKLLGLRITKADLTFKDHSLMDSMLSCATGGQDANRDQARELVCAELGAMAKFAGESDNGVAEDALRGLKRFVDEPGTITITARPNEPVPWLYFFMGRDFYDNLRLLNIKVKTDSGDNI